MADASSTQGESQPAVPVRALLGPEAEGLKLTLLAGARGLDREITLARVQRPGLALTGYTQYLRGDLFVDRRRGRLPRPLDVVGQCELHPIVLAPVAPGGRITATRWG